MEKDKLLVDTVSGIEDFFKLAEKLGNEDDCCTVFILESINAAFGTEGFDATVKMVMACLAEGYVISGINIDTATPAGIDGKTGLAFTMVPERMKRLRDGDGKMIVMSMDSFITGDETKQ